MKVKFSCNSGANSHSARSEVFDTVSDLGLKPGEWESYSDEEKDDAIRYWVADRLEFYWEEV